jgi:hypothetical protein
LLVIWTHPFSRLGFPRRQVDSLQTLKPGLSQPQPSRAETASTSKRQVPTWSSKTNWWASPGGMMAWGNQSLPLLLGRFFFADGSAWILRTVSVLALMILTLRASRGGGVGVAEAR